MEGGAAEERRCVIWKGRKGGKVVRGERDRRKYWLRNGGGGGRGRQMVEILTVR